MVKQMYRAMQYHLTDLSDPKNVTDAKLCDRGYELLEQQADGRGKKVDEIKAIAEGRVWTGEDALKIGLVDKIGG